MIPFNVSLVTSRNRLGGQSGCRGQRVFGAVALPLAGCEKLRRVSPPKLFAPRGARRLQLEIRIAQRLSQHRRKHRTLRGKVPVAVEFFVEELLRQRSRSPYSLGRCRRRSLHRPRRRRESPSSWRCRRCSAGRARAWHRQRARSPAAEPAALPDLRRAYPRGENSRPRERQQPRQSPPPRRAARCRQSVAPHSSPRAADDRASVRGSRSDRACTCAASASR